MVAGLSTAQKTIMTQIGTFAHTSDDSYTGTIKTLAFGVYAPPSSNLR